MTVTFAVPQGYSLMFFSELSHLSDPIPDGEYYKASDMVYGTEINEVHMPSWPFNPSAQTAKVLIKCVSCSKMRLVHSKKSLPAETRSQVEREIQNLWYTCGSVFGDVDQTDGGKTVSIYSLIGVRKNLMVHHTTFVYIHYSYFLFIRARIHMIHRELL